MGWWTWFLARRVLWWFMNRRFVNRWLVNRWWFVNRRLHNRVVLRRLRRRRVGTIRASKNNVEQGAQVQEENEKIGKSILTHDLSCVAIATPLEARNYMEEY
jgi:hypothetical protein